MNGSFNSTCVEGLCVLNSTAVSVNQGTCRGQCPCKFACLCAAIEVETLNCINNISSVRYSDHVLLVLLRFAPL